MQFWAYILRCSDGSYYTGHSDNLEFRLAQHQSGEGCDWTRRRLPVVLVWCENFSSRIDALEAEHRIKPWSRAKKEALIERDWKRLSHFARPPHERPSTSLETNENCTFPRKNSVLSREGSPERRLSFETVPLGEDDL